MKWKNLIGLLVLAPRRRIIATTIVYGLSLAIRFTSATGEEVEIPAHSMQRTYPVMSIMTRDGSQIPYADWDPNAAKPILLRHGWPLRATSMPSCLLNN